MCHTHVDCLERMNDRENKNANLKKQERIEENRLIFVYLLHSWQCGRYFGNKLSFILHRNGVQMAMLIPVSWKKKVRMNKVEYLI